MNNSLFKLVPLQYKNIENTKERFFISMKSDKLKNLLRTNHIQILVIFSPKKSNYRDLKYKLNVYLYFFLLSEDIARPSTKCNTIRLVCFDKC